MEQLPKSGDRRASIEEIREYHSEAQTTLDDN